MPRVVLNENVKRRVLRLKRQYHTRTFTAISTNLEEEGLGTFKARTLNAYYRNYVNSKAKEQVLKKKVYTFKEIKELKWRKDKKGQNIRKNPKFGVMWNESTNIDFISAYQFQNPIDIIDFLLDKLYVKEGNRPLTP